MTVLRIVLTVGVLTALIGVPVDQLWADGKVVPPRNYTGTLEEKSQEAIIIFDGSETAGESIEHLILKIRVEGDAEQFAWVIPFPNVPEVEKEEPELFRDIFNYVESRRSRSGKGEGSASDGEKNSVDSKAAVEVIQREIVGSYDVAIVRENQAGGLQAWLKQESFQSLDDAEDVLEFYRNKGYVFACIKVDSELLATESSIESHPLRFKFATGGRDGIYFPMKMTGLQETPFDVNLYVFYRYWLNDRLNQFGFGQQGFYLHYRDWDTSRCEPNGGKLYANPESDPFLNQSGKRLGSVVELMKRLAPEERFYLTNIQATGLQPLEVRSWPDDLWLFPYYTNTSMIPYDVRDNGPASAKWPDLMVRESDAETSSVATGRRINWETAWKIGAVVLAMIVIAGFFYMAGRRNAIRHMARRRTVETNAVENKTFESNKETTK